MIPSKLEDYAILNMGQIHKYIKIKEKMVETKCPGYGSYTNLESFNMGLIKDLSSDLKKKFLDYKKFGNTKFHSKKEKKIIIKYL